MVTTPLKSAGGVYTALPLASKVIVPTDAVALVTLSVSPSASLAPFNKLKLSGVSSSVVATESGATGGSFTGLTVSIKVTVVTPPLPSSKVYVIVTSPLKSAGGVYVIVPSGLTTTVPTDAVAPVTVTVSPSTSDAPPNTFSVTGVSSFVEPVVTVPTGASFTFVTVTVIVAIAVPPAESVIP